MLLTEFKFSYAECCVLGDRDLSDEELVSATSDQISDALELYRFWKEQTPRRHGAGTPAPSVPRSQRQYDGDNGFDD
jgi:hypothetical protein